MIERFYLKSCLTFKECELNFKKGLIVFTGPSGAGKSVLINSILSLFGLKIANASLSEIVIDSKIDLEDYGYENDEFIVIKQIKKDKVRFFLNAQTVSKKLLKEIFEKKILYLSQKDEKIFKNQNILKIVDEISKKEFNEFKDLKDSFIKSYLEYKDIDEKLKKIYDEEKRVNSLIEFAKFEIEKIDKISPKIDEYEELLNIKKELSKIEKIKEAINIAENIFEYENVVYDVLEKSGKDSSFFDEAMNELRNIFEEQKNRVYELENIDIEEVLNRLEELSELKRRYGSIKEALEYKKIKEEELKRYENLSFEKSSLEKMREELIKSLKNLSKEITEYRKKSIEILIKNLKKYIKDLKLPEVGFRYEKKDLDIDGEDIFHIELKGVGFENISSGEYNRLRLALLAASSDYKKDEDRVLILDEIDANVSGEESMAIAKILKKLSLNYQIFAISHQAQLSSIANQHFLVIKESGESRVLELNNQERIKEIARIISGEEITKEAKDFAEKLLRRGA